MTEGKGSDVDGEAVGFTLGVNTSLSSSSSALSLPSLLPLLASEDQASEL